MFRVGAKFTLFSYAVIGCQNARRTVVQKIQIPNKNQNLHHEDVKITLISAQNNYIGVILTP